MYSYIDGTITSKDDIQFGPKGQKRIHTSFEILINNEGRDTIETIYENQCILYLLSLSLITLSYYI